MSLQYTGYRSVSVTQASNYPDVPRTAPILESHANKIGSQANVVDGIATRLHDLADRLFGREVSKLDQNKQGATPVPETALGKISDANDALSRAIDKCGSAMQRLEAL